MILLIAIPEQLKRNQKSNVWEFKHALIAAQTGTGKTLAYTLPLLHKLKMTEIDAGQRLTSPNRPRGIILVPNRELAIQAEEVTQLKISYIFIGLEDVYVQSAFKILCSISRN